MVYLTDLFLMAINHDFQAAAEISNDFATLIPIGTLHFYDVPATDYALQGIRISRSSWSAFDADFLYSAFKLSTLHESLQALLFLTRHRFFSATYRILKHVKKLACKSIEIYVWKVRVYAVPLEIEGARFMRLWRRSWLLNHGTLDSRAKANWQILLKYLDFTPGSWGSDYARSDRSNSNAKYAKSQFMMCTPFYAPPRSKNSPIVAALKSGDPKHSFFHMQRWLNRGSCCEVSHEHVSMDDIVKEVYVNIQTPDLSYFASSPGVSILDGGVPSAEELISTLVRDSKGENRLCPINGLTSFLYPFQLRSVCKMYEKESILKREPVPHFVTLTSPTGSKYYFDSLNQGFFRNPELYSVPKGGILAENMGLGKTIICLALICLTKHEVSVIPEDLLLHEAPEELSDGDRGSALIRSLADIALESISQNSLPWKYFTDSLPLAITRKLSQLPGKFYVAPDQTQSNPGRRGRSTATSRSSIRQLLLCSTTLVVVPENLLHQWNDEAKKHVTPNFLKVLFISERFKSPIKHESSEYLNYPPQTPSALTQYDAVVISVPLFSKMSMDPQNVFMKVYWKRIIIDEGHSMSSRSSNLSLTCKLILSERRWVVTGTPTSGLTNLHMDEDVHESAAESPRKKRRKYVVKGKFNVKDDLTKLGNLVSNYFKIEPFHSQPGLWASSVIKSLGNSHQAMAKISLQSLLNSLMVRHSHAQVEADLVLPQLHHDAVFLEPSYHNKLALNLFTAVLAVNAVSSERVGVDYMFDPSNRLQLQRLVSNLQLSTFYWTGFLVQDVKSLQGIARHCMEKKTNEGGRYYNEADSRLLENSYAAVQKALKNPIWRAAASLHEMQFYVSDLPPAYISSFATGNIKDIGVYGAPHLHAVQRFFYKNRFLSTPEVLDNRLKESSGDFWRLYWLQSAKKEKGKFSKHEDVLHFDHSKIKEEENGHMLSELRSNHEGYYRPASHDIKRDSSFEESVCDPKHAQILGTGSAKLSYLASKLVGHQKDGIKSIVFFEYEDTAYYLTELLDILGVTYILYATFIGAERRPNNLNDFASHDSASDGGVTLIMDLKLASHGLTVISATRVYFINPVWQRSVEAQAIKRAHRIGQTKEVHVETLVLRGTLEEEIYRRRLDPGSGLDARGSGDDTGSAQKKYVIDDTGMQNFVLRHDFLGFDQSEQEYAAFDEPGHPESRPRDESLLALEDILFSLPSHSYNVSNNSGRATKNWNMRLFSRDNLQKFNESRQEKPDLAQLNANFVEGRSHHLPRVAKKTTGSLRKSVRF